MSFDEYWKQVLGKYPHLSDQQSLTKISVSGLRALMEQSHEKGREMERNIAKFQERTKPKSTSFEDLFKSFTK